MKIASKDCLPSKLLARHMFCLFVSGPWSKINGDFLFVCLLTSSFLHVKNDLAAGFDVKREK